MKRAILSISPIATAFNLSAVFALSVLIFVVPVLATLATEAAFTLHMIWLLPILAFTVMFIVTFIAVLLYNLFAKLAGGIRLELGDAGA